MTRSTVAIPLLALACAMGGHRAGPWASEPDVAAGLEARAEAWCRERSGKVPPHPFTTDGCSSFPDRDWLHCCVEHDIAYWCGGSEEDRERADRQLRDCVEAEGHEWLSVAMRAGVRAGGPPWVPAWWRWGYGWDWPRGYEEADSP